MTRKVLYQFSPFSISVKLTPSFCSWNGYWTEFPQYFITRVSNRKVLLKAQVLSPMEEVNVYNVRFRFAVQTGPWGAHKIMKPT